MSPGGVAQCKADSVFFFLRSHSQGCKGLYIEKSRLFLELCADSLLVNKDAVAVRTRLHTQASQVCRYGCARPRMHSCQLGGSRCVPADMNGTACTGIHRTPLHPRGGEHGPRCTLLYTMVQSSLTFASISTCSCPRFCFFYITTSWILPVNLDG